MSKAESRLDERQLAWVRASKVPEKAAKKISLRTSVLSRSELESQGAPTSANVSSVRAGSFGARIEHVLACGSE